MARTIIMPGRRYEQCKSLAEFRELEAPGRQSLQWAEPVAARHRLRLAIENHKDQRVSERLALLDSLSSEWIGMCVDVGNSLALLEKPLDTVRAFAPYAFTVHLKDVVARESDDGFWMADTALGEGMLDLPEMVQVLRQANPAARYYLETMTRDALPIPAKTEGYWVTMDGVPRSDLDAVLQMLRSSADRAPLPKVSELPPEQQLSLDRHNVQQSLQYAREQLRPCHASCAETTQFTMKSPQLVGNYGEYKIVLLQAPLAASHVESLVELLGHKGEPWLVDIRDRYAGRVATLPSWPHMASNRSVISGSVPTRSILRLRRWGTSLLCRRIAAEGWRGGCFRARCSTMTLRPANCWCWEWTTRPPCHSMRCRISEPARARCARSPGHDSRSCADDLLEGRWPAPQGRLRSVPFGTGLYASGILLLNAFPGDSKLQSLGILNGHEAELQLLEGIWRARRGESLNAFVDEATGCLVRDRTHNA